MVPLGLGLGLGLLLSEVVSVITGVVIVRVGGGVAGVLVMFNDFLDLSVGV